MLALEKINNGPNNNGNDCQGLLESLDSTKVKFISSMDEDFNTAQGIGAIFELIKELNKALEKNEINEKGISTNREV